MVIKQQIVAKFHDVPKGFVKVKTLPKRRNARRSLLLPFRSKTHMTCEVIAMESGIPKSCVHRV